MIELPEARVIAQQMREALTGKRIVSGNRGNATHKFAFASGTAEEYEAILAGKRVGEARGHGNAILVPLEPGHLLVLGGGGERILYHAAGAKLPKKHHLLLRFEDDTALTVTVQGWGNTLLLPQASAGEHPHVQLGRVTPLSEGFTPAYMEELLGQLDEGSKASVKYVLVSEPGVWGIGNGCLQDILFHARIHPRRRAVDLAPQERRQLHDAIQSTLSQMVALGGRESERDLYGERGGYIRILDSKTAGTPCPACGTAIEKASYLGGTIYFCPACQPEKDTS
jgi:formamidopyrimidine-DNA glycosylase